MSDTLARKLGIALLRGFKQLVALIEAAIGYYFGVRFGFPTMLMLVILVLVWRPQGLFGSEKVVRL